MEGTYVEVHAEDLRVGFGYMLQYNDKKETNIRLCGIDKNEHWTRYMFVTPKTPRHNATFLSLRHIPNSTRWIVLKPESYQGFVKILKL